MSSRGLTAETRTGWAIRRQPTSRKRPSLPSCCTMLHRRLPIIGSPPSVYGFKGTPGHPQTTMAICRRPCVAIRKRPPGHPQTTTRPSVDDRAWPSMDDRAGPSVDDPVWPSVDDPVWPSVDDPVWPSVNDPVWPSVDDPVWPSVDDPVWPSVDDPVWPSVDDPVWPSVDDPVWPSVDDPVWPSVDDPGAIRHDDCGRHVLDNVAALTCITATGGTSNTGCREEHGRQGFCLLAEALRPRSPPQTQPVSTAKEMQVRPLDPSGLQRELKFGPLGTASAPQQGCPQP